MVKQQKTHTSLGLVMVTGSACLLTSIYPPNFVHFLKCGVVNQMRKVVQPLLNMCLYGVFILIFIEPTPIT